MNKQKQQLLLELDEEDKPEEINQNGVQEIQEPENQNQIYYNSEFELDKKSKLFGSPVFSEEEIPSNSYKFFESICVWSKSNIVKENLDIIDFIDPAIFRRWAENFLIHPLLEPEYSTWIMTAEGESLLTIFSQFNDSQSDSFSKFYSDHISQQTIDSFWDSEMLRIGIELLTRLGVLRMGKARLDCNPRTWVGRRSEALSPQIKFEALGHDPVKIADGFIKAFVGDNHKKCEWELGYRSALWRLTISDPVDPRVIYIEEYEDNDY